MPRRLAEMAHARPIGPAPAMMAASCCMAGIYPAGASLAGIGVRAQHLVQSLEQIGPDRIDEVYALPREHVLNVDRIEPRDARFLDHINEVQPCFLDEPAELVGAAFSEGHSQQVKVAGGIEALGQKLLHEERPFL